MTSIELRDLVKSHFSLVDAEKIENVVDEAVSVESFSTEEVKEALVESTEEKFDARTDAEEEGYLDGIKDEKEDEKEKLADIESIVEAVVLEVKEEMEAVKSKMAELESAVGKLQDVPASEPTKMSSQPASKAKFSSFNVETSANADRIKAVMAQLKNKTK